MTGATATVRFGANSYNTEKKEEISSWKDRFCGGVTK